VIPALIIGRKGSRVKDKNVRPILGRPLALYPILAAKHAKHITDVFVSTDSEAIQEIAAEQKCTYIERPAFLATNEALAEDAFKHGYEHIARSHSDIEFVVLLFANGATITPGIIDQGIEFLRANPTYDSAVTVSKYNMFSALRARRIDDKGLVKPFVPPALFGDATCDRDSQGDTYFVDCSVFVLRPRCFDYSRGEIPFRWIGQTVQPLHQEGGCDVDFEWQFPVVEHFLRRVGFSEEKTPYA
jgi:hypothetical protein